MRGVEFCCNETEKSEKSLSGGEGSKSSQTRFSIGQKCVVPQMMVADISLVVIYFVPRPKLQAKTVLHPST